MSFEQFRNIINRDLNYRHSVLLYGQGEPFLNPDIFKMITYEREKKNFVTTVTNGTLLDKSLCENVISSGLNVLRISLDSSVPEIYNSIRRNSDFNLVIDNLSTLVQMMGKKKSGLRLCIVVMVMDNNLHDLPGLVLLCDKLGIPNIEIKEIPNYKIGGDLSLSRMAKQDNRIEPEFIRIMNETLQCARDKKINVILPELVLSDKKPLCLNPWFKTYITFTGRVTPCSRYFSNSHYTCGNLLLDSFDHIWNNEYYKKFRMANKSANFTAGCFNECILA